jgi:hypothetical protein
VSPSVGLTDLEGALLTERCLGAFGQTAQATCYPSGLAPTMTDPDCLSSQALPYFARMDALLEVVAATQQLRQQCEALSSKVRHLCAAARRTAENINDVQATSALNVCELLSEISDIGVAKISNQCDFSPLARLLANSRHDCMLQATCISHKAPKLLTRIQHASSPAVLADVSAPRVPSSAKELLHRSCAAGSKPAALPSLQELQQQGSQRFADLQLPWWRRVYVSEAVDNIFIAVCALAATVALGAVIMRIVRFRRGSQLSSASISRELAYSSMLVLPGSCFMPRCCSRRGHRASDIAAASMGAAARSRSRQSWFVAVPAVLVWVVFEVRLSTLSGPPFDFLLLMREGDACKRQLSCI